MVYTNKVSISNLFLSIINSRKQANYEDSRDHIIIIFINTSDIRFNGMKECVDTINDGHFFQVKNYQ